MEDNENTMGFSLPDFLLQSLQLLIELILKSSDFLLNAVVFLVLTVLRNHFVGF